MLRRGAEPRPASCSRTRSWLPPMPPEVTITAWARELEVADLVAVARLARARAASGASTAPRDAGRRRRRSTVELVDPVAEARASTRPAARRASRTRRSNGSTTPGPGAPGDVEARHRVAVAVGAVAAALGPADDREEPHALLVQPGALLAGGEVDVGLGPPPRPVVLRRGRTPARAQPVLQASSWESLMPHPALLGGVDEEQPAERPERLAAEATASGSWSSSSTRRPASASSAVATSPARPAPTTIDVSPDCRDLCSPARTGLR